MSEDVGYIEEHEHEHIVPRSVYFTIFGALMVLTAITVAVAFMDLGAANISVAVVIAIVKATLVVLFFMHIKYSSRLTQLVAATGVVWLLILFGITLSDYLARGWLISAPVL